MSRLRTGGLGCHCAAAHQSTKLIAVTGGPGAGKSAVLEVAAQCFCRHVGMLPEAASVLFGGGFPRHDTDAGLRAAQRAIFHVQRQAEQLVVEENEVAVVVCDRGTLDTLAYWPGSVESYWPEVGTTPEAELMRYEAVIHLNTPTEAQGYNHQNALRIEDASVAQGLNARTLEAWSDHPNRIIIPSHEDFIEKARQALRAIRAALPSCCHGHSIP